MTTCIRLVLLVAWITLSYVSAFAQTQTEPRRIGLLSSISQQEHAVNRRALLEGLEERGYVDGKNVAIEYRYANGDRGRLTELATELVNLDVDLIIAVGPPTIAAAMQATKDIPIVMVSGGDVIGRGFVANLAQPGGNVTGLHSLSKSSGKRLMLLKEAFPSLSRVAVLNARKRKHTVEAYQRHAKGQGLAMHVVNIRKAEELDEAFAEIRAAKPQGLLVVRSPLTRLHAKKIADFAIEEKLPSMYRSEHFVRAGGLMSYGLDYQTMHRRAAVYVDKILKGTEPGVLPVEPPQHRFVINLKTAGKIGATIPPELLLEADEVIQ